MTKISNDPELKHPYEMNFYVYSLKLGGNLNERKTKKVGIDIVGDVLWRNYIPHDMIQKKI